MISMHATIEAVNEEETASRPLVGFHSTDHCRWSELSRRRTSLGSIPKTASVERFAVSSYDPVRRSPRVSGGARPLDSSQRAAGDIATLDQLAERPYERADGPAEAACGRATSSSLTTPVGDCRSTSSFPCRRTRSPCEGTITSSSYVAKRAMASIGSTDEADRRIHRLDSFSNSQPARSQRYALGPAADAKASHTASSS